MVIDFHTLVVPDEYAPGAMEYLLRIGGQKAFGGATLDELKKLDLSNVEHFLVSPEGIGPWDTTETNRRNYFSKRFKKAKIQYNLFLKQESILEN